MSIRALCSPPERYAPALVSCRTWGMTGKYERILYYTTISHGKSGWLTYLCLLFRHGFSLRPRAASSAVTVSPRYGLVSCDSAYVRLLQPLLPGLPSTSRPFVLPQSATQAVGSEQHSLRYIYIPYQQRHILKAMLVSEQAGNVSCGCTRGW
jgi:hypothetical protein